MEHPKTPLIPLCMALLFSVACSLSEPAPEPTIVPTDTPVPTSTATEAPPTPTATLVVRPSPSATAGLSSSRPATAFGTPPPLITPPSDWRKFEGKNIELWLPNTFDAAGSPEDLDVLIERMRRLGPEYRSYADYLDQNRDAFVLYAIDLTTNFRGFVSTVNVVTERTVSIITLDLYMSAAAQRLPSSFSVKDQKIVSLSRYTAGRMLIEFELYGMQGTELFYIIKDGNTMWAVLYACSRAEFEQRLPTFERSMNTFYIKPSSR